MKTMRKVILLVPSGREYERGLLRGIASYAQIHGPWIFFEEPPPYLNGSGLDHCLAHMKDWGADGVIAHQPKARGIKALNLPTVILCSTHHLPEKTCQIQNDDQAIGTLAADYLLGLGLKHLAYCGLHNMEWSSHREKAFCRRAAQCHLKAIRYRPFTPRPGESWYLEEQYLGDWLVNLPKPVGLLACNDDRGRMIAEICRIRGIQVPDDISILGVDNDEQVCNRSHPPLSSVSLTTESAGYEAAASLDRLMAGKPAKSHIILAKPIQVVPRQSTDLIAVDDPNVVKALLFIRKNSTHKTIRLCDVIAVSGVSRRILQDRFNNILGRTILDEIHQTRIQHISRILSTTNLSIAAVASAIGYEDEGHLARFFSRKTGMTPSAYRRIHRKG